MPGWWRWRQLRLKAQWQHQRNGMPAGLLCCCLLVAGGLATPMWAPDPPPQDPNHAAPPQPEEGVAPADVTGHISAEEQRQIAESGTASTDTAADRSAATRSMPHEAEARARGNAVSAADEAEIQQELNSIIAALTLHSTSDYGSGLAQNVIAEGAIQLARDNARIARGLAPGLGEAGERIENNENLADPLRETWLHEIPTIPGYGFVGQAERLPSDPDAVPQYVTAGEVENLAASINDDANKLLDEVEEFLSDDLKLGGCNEFDFASEFAVLFNKETLSNFLKNLKEGAIAAAPMALLQAVSPELANLIQHLKGMASVALQIANGNCETAKAALTPAFERMFNGPRFDECLRNQRESGLLLEHAKRACTAKSRVAKENTWIGKLVKPINKFGAALNNRLEAMTAAVNGRGSYTDNLRRMNSMDAAALEAVQTQGTLPGLHASAEDLAGDVRDLEAAAAEGTLTDAQAVDLTNKRKALENARKNYAEAHAKTQASYRAALHLQAGPNSAISQLYMSATDDDRRKQARRLLTQYHRDEDADALNTAIQGQLKNWQPRASTDGVDEEEANKGDYTRNMANQIGDLYENRDSVPIVGPILGAAGEFIENYMPGVFSIPSANIGFSVGAYNFSWTHQQVNHHGMELSWDAMNVLPDLWNAWARCKPEADSYISEMLAIVHVLADEPWKTNPTLTAIAESDARPPAIENAKITKVTVLKIASAAHLNAYGTTNPYAKPISQWDNGNDDDPTATAKRRRLAHAGVALAKAFYDQETGLSFGLQEAVNKICEGAIAAYLLNIATGTEMEQRIIEFDKMLSQALVGAENPEQDKKALLDQVRDKQKETARVLGVQLYEAARVIATINATAIDVVVPCPGTLAGGSVQLEAPQAPRSTYALEDLQTIERVE